MSSVPPTRHLEARRTLGVPGRVGRLAAAYTGNGGPGILHGGGAILVGLVLIVAGGLLLAFHRRIGIRYDRIGGFANRTSPRWVRSALTLGGGAFLILLGAFVVGGGIRSIAP